MQYNIAGDAGEAFSSEEKDNSGSENIEANKTDGGGKPNPEKYPQHVAITAPHHRLSCRVESNPS